QSPEGLVDRISYAVQTKEEHSKRLALRLVDAAEQAVEREREHEEEDRAGDVGHHAEAKELFVGEEVGGGRGGVAAHNQLAEQVDKDERSRYDEQQVEPACSPGLPIECIHGAPLFLRLA